MVVIIDDRGDVWKWSDNLIKVSPYDFFVGIGDINSSFLPKKQELKVVPKSALHSRRELESADLRRQLQPSPPEVNGSGMQKPDGTSNAEVSALEQLVTMGGGDNPMLLQEQASEQEVAIAQQVEERPLLQRQRLLDAEDDAAESSSTAENGESAGDESQEPTRHRHHLLEDNDTELYQLQERLRIVHKSFYDEYDRRRTQSLGGRISALRGERVPSKDKAVDLRIVPDIKVIMPQIKRRILEAVVLVFSGVLPLGTDTQRADISLWAKSFGAIVTQKINSQTTHLVAGRNRTAKVREATRYPNIKIVTVQWLLDSMTQWKRLDEESYLVPVHPDDRGEPIKSTETPSGSKDSNISPDDTLLMSSSEDDTSTISDDESDASKMQIQTDNLEDVDEEILLSSGMNEHSQIGYDAEQKAAVRDELMAFLGSDNEDSESDIDFLFMEDEPTTSSLKKRKRDEESDESGAESGVPGDETRGKGPGSRLACKIKRSYERSTGLKEVANVGSSGSSEAPTPLEANDQDAATEGAEPTGNDADIPDNNIEGDHVDDVAHPIADDTDEDEDSLEREMLAAFEDEDWDDEAKEDEPVAGG
jgi:RNA polymerase II subunit A-like phosphatase